MSPAHEGFAAVVLAAGTSQRMGRDKTTLPWLGGKTLLEWMVETLLAASWSPIVVLGPQNHSLWIGRLPNASLVLNARAALGKTTSIAAGAAALPFSASHILLGAIDQPRPPSLYRALRRSAVERPEPIIVPGDKGRHGHPVVLKSELRPRLLELRESAGGLRGLLGDPSYAIHCLSCNTAAPQWDCNTPAIYQEALAWFGSHVQSADDGHCQEIR